MKWLITGGGGMVANDLRRALEDRGEDVLSLARADLDVTNARNVSACVKENKPNVIVNCAAFTRVDDAEAHEHIAMAVNGSSVEFLAQSANDVDALLVQLSTDFVFDGSQKTPYDINDTANPLSSYGRSKHLGEVAARHAKKYLVVRTSWLFGTGGHNFVEAMRGQIRKGTNPLRVVNDQTGRPTYTPHLASAIIRIVHCGGEGIIHYADAPACTWFDFATAIVHELGDPVAVVPVASADFPRPAARPAYSVLSTERYERLTGVKPESWLEGLQEYLAQRA